MNHAVNPERIDAEYIRLGYNAGWRFMTCPERQFENPDLLLVSLNPSGLVEHGPRWSQEDGSAYVQESWDGQAPGRDTLQIQIQRLVAHLGCNFDGVASAHFVPFRSQRWADLPHSKEAVSFAHALWSDFADGLNPKYVVCLGNEVGKYVPKIFGVERMEKKKTGWGEISLGVGRGSNGSQVIVLPHLGTFKLFSRAECVPFLKNAIGPESVTHA